MAIIARWRMPPENWCGKSFARIAAFGIPTAPSSSTERFQACFFRHLLVGENGLGDLVADAVHRMEAGERILEDHRHVAPADMA